MTVSLALEVENLSYSYPPARRGAEPRTALRGVSFSVRAGEIFGLLGPNGGGKTTLFKLLCTLLLPTSGRAKINSLDTRASANEIRRQLGVAFQSPSLDKKLSVEENVLHHGHLYGLRGNELKRRIQTVLERFRLQDRSKEIVETLSGGMCRRVELAKAMLHRPRVLLLDEPSTGLDPGARRDLWDHLKMLREASDVTVLLTTHLMEEAAECDRLALLHLGQVVALGTPGELVSQIGGDVVTVRVGNPQPLAGEIRNRFGVTPAILDGSIRIECREGHKFIPQLVESFPGQIQSISMGKPTLEDVFIQRTGHRIDE